LLATPSFHGPWWRRPPVDDDPAHPALGIEPLWRISRIDRHTSAALRAVYRRHDCDAGEYDVLAALRRTGPPHALTPTELSRSVLVNTATMTERLTRMEQRGRVRRTRSDRDRRSVSVDLTDAGRDLVDAAAEDLLEVERGLLAGLAETDRRSLARLLATLAADLDGRERP